jgi:FkbM family methyltransferase
MGLAASLFDHVHRTLGRARWSSSLAVKVRNQARAIVKYHLSDGHDPSRNGEAWLIKEAAQPGSVFVDAGANVGAWTSLWLERDPFPRAGLLLDPASVAVATLARRFGHLPQLKILSSGVADASGELTFFERANAAETAGFTPLEGGVPVARPVTTIDEECDREDLENIDFLKIDVEGYDFHAIRGAARRLSSQAVSVLQFEYGEAWAEAGSTLRAAISYLKRHGYLTLLLKRDGLWHLDYERYGEYFAYSNYVSLSPGAQERLGLLIRGVI